MCGIVLAACTRRAQFAIVLCTTCLWLWVSAVQGHKLGGVQVRPTLQAGAVLQDLVVHFGRHVVVLLLGPHALQLGAAMLTASIVQVKAKVVQLLQLGLQHEEQE